MILLFYNHLDVNPIVFAIKQSKINVKFFDDINLF